MISRRDLARGAIHIEQSMIRENVGSQDQTLSAYGGLNVVEFMPNGEIVVSPVIMRPEVLQDFESRLLLVFTGHSRSASEVAAEQISSLPGKLPAMERMKTLVDEALALLTAAEPDLDAFGGLLNETWEIKRDLSCRITTPEIDAIHRTALRNGALGGKLLGAGGGGCMLFYVRREDRERLIQALHAYLVVPFRFDFDGSRIIVYDPNYPGRRSVAGCRYPLAAPNLGPEEREALRRVIDSGRSRWGPAWPTSSGGLPSVSARATRCWSTPGRPRTSSASPPCSSARSRRCAAATRSSSPASPGPPPTTPCSSTA